jgi:hemolysin D
MSNGKALQKQVQKSAPVPNVVERRNTILSRMARSDREFLPAALEILETPPAPASMYMIRVVVALVVLALAWSYFGRLDIIATAQGKVQPIGRVKIIQPLETGKVHEINVANGQRVKAGDTLIQLEDTEAIADEKAMQNALAAWSGEALRRRVAVDLAQRRAFQDAPVVQWPANIPETVRGRESRILSSDIRQLGTAVASLTAQQKQKLAEITGLQSTITQQTALVTTLRDRVRMRSALVENNAGSKASLIDANETLQTQQTTLATQQSQLDQAVAYADVLPIEISKTINTFIAENAQKLSEAERQADDLQQKLNKAAARTGYTTLTSPISGRVAALAVTTVGQVVGPGMELMRVVPDDAGLEIEAYLLNRDIGFVHPGQTAVVKIESFPFTRYGTIDADVIRVSTDAIPEPDASQSEANPTKSGRSLSEAGGQRVQNLVYPITLNLRSSAIKVDDAQVPLVSGMTVTVEIRTGSRRVLSYLLSPLTEVVTQSMRER